MIVLEEVFEDIMTEEGIVKVYLGKIVIYGSQLTPEQVEVCKTWPKKYKDKLKEHGIDVE